MKSFKSLLFCVFLIGLALPNSATSQSLTTGDIKGQVTDPSKAVVAEATVSLKSLDTGAAQETKTNGEGYFSFSLLKPGAYEITVAKAGFANMVRRVDVALGASAAANFQLEITSQGVTVEVTTAIQIINQDAAPATSFSAKEVQLLPTPGGDISNIAFTSPGVLVATNQSGNSGYGNFTANGLPATSNLYTTNGENNMDPYFNINNSGATNLTLGANEVQEATVTTNPYSGQYGQLSGAQVSYVTKSGTNQFHGNAQYWWNGRYMNANDFFNKWTVPAGEPNPAPFSNANQWATSVGGPIVKDKTFFFVDYEGLRFILPNLIPVTTFTPDFANAVLNNIQAGGPTGSPDVQSEYSTYQQLFNLYANAPGVNKAVPQAIGAEDNGCKNVSLAGFDPSVTPCYAEYSATPSALGTEWFLTARLDQKIGNKDNIFARYKVDHGTQPTYLDPISSNFDALSNQPSWDLQINEAHTFSPTMSNNFTAAGSHYVAQFQQNYDLASSTLPFRVITASPSAYFTSFNPITSFPQGRNITQYQFIDDFIWSHGKHTFHFGGNFRRYDVSDHNFFWTSPGVYWGYTNNGLQNFVDGLAYQYRQALNPMTDVPIASWGLGLYAEDNWKVNSQFTLTLVLRAERNSNPVCQHDCFANFTGPLNTLPSYNAADPGSIPYSQDIKYNQHQAFQGVDPMVWSPRIGFSWAPKGTDHFPWFPGGGKTVISGGFGVFYDNPAVSLVDDLLANPPVSTTFRVRPAGGVLPFAPGPNGAQGIWQAAANAFDITKSYNDIVASLPTGVAFNPPAFNAVLGTIHAPLVYEWNLMVQQQIGQYTSVAVNYVGNAGSRLPYSNSWVNAYDYYGIFGGNVAAIPSAPPDYIYGTVTQTQSGAITNYNGMNVTVTERLRNSLVAHFNYTFGHNLDESSNGGLSAYGFSSGQSILQQLSPLGLRSANYGNSDYDIRHFISADFVWTPTVHAENNFVRAAFNGWQFSGKIYWRTGMPYSIVDGNDNGYLLNYGGSILATRVGPSQQTGSCGRAFLLNPAADPTSQTPCLNGSGFFDSYDYALPGVPNQNRNQYRAAGFFDLDMGVFKNFAIKERVNLGIGLMAFNALNHMNPPFPDNTYGDSTFGFITGGPGVGSPTSPYGNFLGFDSSPRVVQLSAKITF